MPFSFSFRVNIMISISLVSEGYITSPRLPIFVQSLNRRKRVYRTFTKGPFCFPKTARLASQKGPEPQLLPVVTRRISFLSGFLGNSNDVSFLSEDVRYCQGCKIMCSREKGE